MGLRECSQPCVELQSVEVRIADVELPGTPGCARNGSHVRESGAFAKLSKKSIHVENYKPIRRSIIGIIPFLPVVPLKMNFDVIAPNPGIPRLVRYVLAHQRKAKFLIEANRTIDVARHEHGMDRLKFWFHSDLRAMAPRHSVAV